MVHHTRSGLHLLLTCEHAGNRVPAAYRSRFRGADRALASHRGWDPGALTLARAVGRRLDVAVVSVSWSRLLVESNRAPTNPRIWSPWTASLPADEKDEILDRYWRPHRQRVDQAVRDVVMQGAVVLHVAVHSFTPVLNGERRNADIGLLYDPGRSKEQRACVQWAGFLRGRDPALRVRRNYPYRGTADGLTTWLRRRHPVGRYLGIELEVNQAYLRGPRRTAVARTLAETLRML